MSWIWNTEAKANAIGKRVLFVRLGALPIAKLTFRSKPKGGYLVEMTTLSESPDHITTSVVLGSVGHCIRQLHAWLNSPPAEPSDDPH